LFRVVLRSISGTSCRSQPIANNGEQREATASATAFATEPAAKKALANEAIEARLASAAPARKPTSASVYSSFFARAQARKAATWAVGRL